ncbi:winged helix-turn-helix domain-containing protein [Helicobacter pametensis]|uniref:winged helix-turn-helix domain-containing protein n=1 Tax=Helicobacter pametensis TaxID=95149 RepID=UPI0004B665F3|nr:LysR family transcriptional regulator [Helicobacter pametensis]
MARLKIHSRIWIKKEGKNYLGNGRIQLLKHIKEEGSLLKASKKMYMSYKAAWDSLHQIKEINGEELVISNNGGRGGGGSKLTPHGEQVIEVFEALENLKTRFWSSFDECETLDEMMEKIQMWEEQLKQMGV